MSFGWCLWRYTLNERHFICVSYCTAKKLIFNDLWALASVVDTAIACLIGYWTSVFFTWKIIQLILIAKTPLAAHNDDQNRDFQLLRLSQFPPFVRSSSGERWPVSYGPNRLSTDVKRTYLYFYEPRKAQSYTQHRTRAEIETSFIGPISMTLGTTQKRTVQNFWKYI